MTLLVDTIATAPNSDYVLNAIDTALLANGYEKVADVPAGGDVTKPYRVYKNPQAQNGCPHDWFLAIRRESDADLYITVGELWDAATHRITASCMNYNGVSVLEADNYRLDCGRVMSTGGGISGKGTPYLLYLSGLTGGFCLAVTPQSFSFSRSNSTVDIYIGRFEPMNNHAQENGFAVCFGGQGSIQWMPTRVPSQTYFSATGFPAQPLGPLLVGDRLLAGRPRAARALLLDGSAARGVLKNLLLLSIGGQWGDLASVDTDGVLVDYVNVGLYMRADAL